MKYIHRLYLMPLILLWALFAYSQVQVYREIKSDIVLESTYYNHIFSNTTRANLHEIEIILDNVGYQLLTDDIYLNPVETKYIVQEMLLRTKNLLGFALFDRNGVALSYSGTSKKSVPPLHGHIETQGTFLETLQKRTMVVGRAYYSDVFHQWVIPFRKALTDNDGRVIGVISTAVSMDVVKKTWSEATLHENQRSVIIKDVGRWAVYSSPLSPEHYNTVLNKPLTKDVFNYHYARMAEVAGIEDINELRTLDTSFQYEDQHPRTGVRSLFTMEYDKRYQLWVMTYLPISTVWDLYLNDFLKRIPLFLAILLLFLFVFRKIYLKEQEAGKALIFQAKHDPLTHLLNRSVFPKLFPKWIRDNADGFYFLHLDLDNFKHINDTFGHSLGDQVLIDVAKRLNAIKPDSSDIIRHGGDEFTIFIKPSLNEDIESFCQSAIESIARPYNINNMNAYIGCSIGVSRFPKDGTNRELLMIAADLALHDAKKTRNTYAFFTEKMQQELVRKSMLERSLRRAVANNEMYMMFQPQVLTNGTVYGMEALLRWEHPQHGFVPPDEFIGIAEGSGFMVDIGKFVIEQSCKEFKEIEKRLGELGKQLTLSINISVQQLFEKGFQHYLFGVLSSYDIDKKRIILEITETLFIDELDYTLPLLNNLRQNGIHISLDDFGTGYSSLSMLRTLPIDELKIDKAFVDNIVTDKQDAEMVSSIISMGHIMGMTIVAEGVEDLDQVQMLTKLGCNIFQGYHFSRPLKKEQLIEFVSRQNSIPNDIERVDDLPA